MAALSRVRATGAAGARPGRDASPARTPGAWRRCAFDEGLVIGAAAGKRTLTVRDAQHVYVFREVGDGAGGR